MYTAYIQEERKTTLTVDGASSSKPVSFHFLLATIGRPTLRNMVNSILPQLQKQDFLTIVFDGIGRTGAFKPEEYETELSHKTLATIKVIVEPVNLGSWGHGIRSKHQNLEGDFVLHCDDDDVYVENSIEIVRRIVSEDLEALYIFNIVKKGKIFPICRTIWPGNLSTQNGVIPSKLNCQAKWPLRYGGDGIFYVDIEKIAKRVIFVDFLIYIMAD